jgi:hypothetical protein
VAWAALVAWVATALGGGVLGRQWASHGGPRQASGIRTPRLALHAGLAFAGLVVWIVFLITDDESAAWLAVALLVAVVLVGLTMLALWLRGRSSPEHPTELPAESAFPLPVVMLHGLLGATTLLLSVLAAIGVG